MIEQFKKNTNSTDSREVKNNSDSSIETTVAFNKAVQQPLSELARQTKHVFVTGAGGFLGKAICRLLRLADIKVTGFARGSYPETQPNRR